MPYFFASTFLVTLAATGVRLLAPHRVIVVVVAWARLQLVGRAHDLRHTLAGDRRDCRQGPALIASHHESAFDTLIWLTLLPRPAYVMKQELGRIPLFGALTRPAGMIAVDRLGGAKAMRRLIRDAARAVAGQRQIVIFPEGTRAEPGTLLPLQPGVVALAASTRLPVIPVATDFGALLGPARLPQTARRDPHRAAAPDRGGDSPPGSAPAAGGGAAKRRRGVSTGCGQVCGLTLRHCYQGNVAVPPKALE